jgi:hypothetical protein
MHELAIAGLRSSGSGIKSNLTHQSANKTASLTSSQKLLKVKHTNFLPINSVDWAREASIFSFFAEHRRGENFGEW